MQLDHENYLVVQICLKVPFAWFTRYPLPRYAVTLINTHISHSWIYSVRTAVSSRQQIQPLLEYTAHLASPTCLERSAQTGTYRSPTQAWILSTWTLELEGRFWDNIVAVSLLPLWDLRNTVSQKSRCECWRPSWRWISDCYRTILVFLTCMLSRTAQTPRGGSNKVVMLFRRFYLIVLLTHEFVFLDYTFTST